MMEVADITAARYSKARIDDQGAEPAPSAAKSVELGVLVQATVRRTDGSMTRVRRGSARYPRQHPCSSAGVGMPWIMACTKMPSISVPSALAVSASQCPARTSTSAASHSRLRLSREGRRRAAMYNSISTIVRSQWCVRVSHYILGERLREVDVGFERGGPLAQFDVGCVLGLARRGGEQIVECLVVIGRRPQRDIGGRRHRSMGQSFDAAFRHDSERGLRDAQWPLRIDRCPWAFLCSPLG